MTSLNFAIGMLAYSRPLQIRASLEAIQKNNHPEVPTYLLQNGMGDDDFINLLQTYPWVIGIKNPVNLGAAGGRNRLVDLISSNGHEYAFLLDSDAVLSDHALEKLQEIVPNLLNPGAISCLVCSLESPGEVVSSGVTFDKNPPWQVTYKKNRPIEPYISIPILMTIAVLVPCRPERDIPGFDERFFVYWEDADWCLELLSRGLINYLCRDAIVFHPSQQFRFTPSTMYYMARNQVLFIQKHGHDKKFATWFRFIYSFELSLLRRIRALTPLALTCFTSSNLGFFHAWIRRWGKAPAWMYKDPNTYLEYRLIHLWLIPFLKSIRGKVTHPSG